ncbi:hypothetical protein JL721_105 [Aureococcus anophagefferens]|nr:hypothetical protein JL721_105 [Aureococcus anophagefferens]
MAPRGRSRSRSRSRSRERKERKERRKREKERDAEDQRAAARRAAPAPAAAPAAAAPDEKVDYAKLRDTLNLKSGGDGEVSLSVEDTDALRARLGLKPLNSSTSASATAEREAAERNFALARAAQQEARRLAEIEGELAREAAPRRAPVVAGGNAAVGRGEELILTLADEQILDYDEGKHGKLVGLRKGSGGTLVNQERAESAKREGTLADRRDERLLHAGGTATDDWEFDGGGAVAGAGGPLAKYDARGPRGAKLVIGAGGVVSVADQAHLSGAAIARLAETLGDGRSGAELGADGDAGDGGAAAARRPAPAAGAKFLPGLGDDDDDAELQASLARARAAVEEDPRGQRGRPALAATVKAEPRAEGDAPADADALVFTSTTEFTARLHARLEERAAENAEASAEAAADAFAARGGAAVKAEARLPPDESDSGAMSDSDDESLAAAEAEDRGDLIDFLHKQPLARDGVAATMGLLRQTGDVQIKHVEQKVGRARDQTIFEDGTEDDPAAPPDPSLQFKPIKLEYRDADGRLLTRKEAFRQMCHKFHGKGPGKKKQEKFAAREAERQRSIKMAASEDDEDPELAAMRARMESLFAMPAAPESEPIIAEEPPVAAEAPPEAPPPVAAEAPPEAPPPVAAEPPPPVAAEPAQPRETYDMPPNLASAQARDDAGRRRPRPPAGVALDVARSRRAGEAILAAVLEGKRRVLVEARVEGLDPQQPKFDRAVVDAWARDLVEKLPYGAALVLGDRPRRPALRRRGVAGALLRRFDAPVGDDAAPEDAVVVVFAPSSTDDMVATRRAFKAGAARGVPVVVVNGAFETEPIEYRDATEVYALRPLVVAGGNTALPVRVVVNRKYPAPYDVWVDPGTGEYAKAAEFAEAPSNAELTPVIRAALEAN